MQTETTEHGTEPAAGASPEATGGTPLCAECGTDGEDFGERSIGWCPVPDCGRCDDCCLCPAEAKLAASAAGAGAPPAEGRKGLYRTTVVIWSEYDPSGTVELEDLAREATRGDAYCSKSDSVFVADPLSDPDPPGDDFFRLGPDVGEEEEF